MVRFDISGTQYWNEQEPSIIQAGRMYESSMYFVDIFEWLENGRHDASVYLTREQLVSLCGELIKLVGEPIENVDTSKSD